MLEQLDLLSYTPSIEEMIEPPPEPKPPSNAEIHQQFKADYYLKLMQRMMSGRCSRAVRSNEIERLQSLRSEALSKVGGNR